MKPLLIILFLLFSSTLLSQTVTFIPVGGKTIYDLQSNGSPQQIIVNPNNPDEIHVVYVTSPYNDDTLFTNRKTAYYYTSNGGSNWSYLGNVTPLKSGFASISILSDGIPIISLNRTAGIETRAVAYVDAFPGLGSFTELDPGSSKTLLWPRAIGTSSIGNANKFILIGGPVSSVNSIVIGKSLINSNFDYSDSSFNSNIAEGYAIARGNDGRIGIAFIGMAPTQQGAVYFMESTNNGQSFTKQKIFQPITYPNGDLLGALRGISIAYQSNTPKVVFETVRQTTSGVFYPSISSQIRFWSPNLPGNDPNKCIIIADSTNVPFFPMLTQDGEAPVCRPVIGATKNLKYIFVAFVASSGQSLNNRSYKDIYITRSINGLTWGSPERINPISPRMDYSYPSMSPIITSAGNQYRVDMTLQKDTIPGTHVNGAAKSFAENIYCNYTYTSIPAPAPPYIPVLLSPPTNKASWWFPPPLLDWDTVVCNNYHLQVSMDSTFSTSLINEQNLTASQYQPPSSLPINTWLYWRVRAQNSEGYSGWSNVWSFISYPIGITNESEIAYEYKLFNNYPNPFNPETNIRFSLPESEVVSLIVYDIKGAEVERLISNQRFNSGIYNFKFNASNLTSGIYFYRLQTSDFTETKKMLLIK